MMMMMMIIIILLLLLLLFKTNNNTGNSNNNNTWDNAYGAVVTAQVISRVHPVHLMNADATKRLPNLRPSQPTWAVSPPICCYC